MGIWLYQVKNKGDVRSVVKYGTLPNSTGPTSNGYSVLLKERAAVPDWCIGYEDNPVVVETKHKGRYTWKIYDGDWELNFKVSVDGGKFFHIGVIKILHNYARFEIWTYGDKLVIGNEDNKLGRASDGKPFKYFLITMDQIEPYNHFPL